MRVFFLLALGLLSNLSFADSKLEAIWKAKCDHLYRCSATLPVIVENQDQQRVVAGLTYFYNPPGDVLRIRFTPNATRSAGVGIKVDQNKAIQLPISNCDDKICEVNIVVDEQLLSELRAGQWLLLAYQENTQQRTIPVQIYGFNSLYQQWQDGRNASKQ